MISILFLILIFIWFYKKRTSYNPYDISLSHSSYYECAFCREEKCTEEVLRILEPVAGHKRILKNVFLQGEKDGRAGADVVMIHESGIYVIHSANLEGVIAGNPQGRYWKQTFREGWLLACRNYLYNPFLENTGCYAMGVPGYALASLLFLCGFRKPGRAPYIGMDGRKLFLTAGSCAVFGGSGCFPP